MCGNIVDNVLNVNIVPHLFYDMKAECLMLKKIVDLQIIVKHYVFYASKNNRSGRNNET